MEEPRTPARGIPRPSGLPFNMNDAELDQLFTSCIPRLQRTARLMLRDPQDSEDAVQEGLLLAFRNLKQFQGRSSFSTWLHSILRNVARTHYRRMKCRPKCSLEEELSNEKESKFEHDFVAPGRTPEQECELRERARLLREVIQELPSGYAFAMQLCDVEGLEPRDASQILGISSCALKTCLFRARRITARRMRARFHPPAQGMPINAHSGSQPQLGSPFRMAGSPLGDMQLSGDEKKYPTHAGARKRLEVLRGNHEPRRKRPHFGKHDLSAFNSVHTPLRNTRRPFR
jgi:RNA polymerase sigma factor (sigma-70 family)